MMSVPPAAGIGAAAGNCIIQFTEITLYLSFPIMFAIMLSLMTAANHWAAKGEEDCDLPKY